MLDDDFGLRTEGGLIYAHTEAQLETLREFVEARQADGVDMRLIDGDEARAMAPILPATVVGASFCPDDAQMESPRYVRAFARAAERHGATVLEGTRVQKLERDGARIARIVTEGRTFTPGRVVIAAGAWTPELLRQVEAEIPIHAMRLQVVQTAPMPRRLGPVLYGPAAVKQYKIFRELRSFRREDWTNEAEQRHGKALLEAVCQRADGSYLLGCAMDYPGFVWEPDLPGVALVTESLPAIMPVLQGAAFARAWAGILPFTTDNLPIIDALPGFDDAFVAAGHVFGNGAGPTTGRLIASFVCGGEPIMDPTPFRADRPGLFDPVDTSVW
jgi:glycine/D-amino acid oxidase-like deaminating enzyme